MVSIVFIKSLFSSLRFWISIRGSIFVKALRFVWSRLMGSGRIALELILSSNGVWPGFFYARIIGCSLRMKLMSFKSNILLSSIEVWSYDKIVASPIVWFTIDTSRFILSTLYDISLMVFDIIFFFMLRFCLIEVSSLRRMFFVFSSLSYSSCSFLYFSKDITSYPPCYTIRGMLLSNDWRRRAALWKWLWLKSRFFSTFCLKFFYFDIRLWFSLSTRSRCSCSIASLSLTLRVPKSLRAALNSSNAFCKSVSRT